VSSVEELEAIEDPYERADAATRALEVVEEHAEQIRTVRDLAFSVLYHEKKESLRAIADRYGMSKTRVSDITR
jgi:hypothetical protein